jgi:hypothetical protein
MDSSFTIRLHPVASRTQAPRNPVAAREKSETELGPTKVVMPADHEPRDPNREHLPHDVVADPESREVINRENDVRSPELAREHPDQALLRQRAYRSPSVEPEHPPAHEPHANIKA